MYSGIVIFSLRMQEFTGNCYILEEFYHRMLATARRNLFCHDRQKRFPMILIKRWKYANPSMLEMKAQRQSTFFVKNELRICSFRLIGADQDEIHIGQNAEAASSAQFGFQLIPEISCLII